MGDHTKELRSMAQDYTKKVEGPSAIESAKKISQHSVPYSALRHAKL